MGPWKLDESILIDVGIAHTESAVWFSLRELVLAAVIRHNIAFVWQRNFWEQRVIESSVACVDHQTSVIRIPVRFLTR